MLRRVGDAGGIRSVEAGVIVHAHRRTGGRIGCNIAWQIGYGGIGCCRYAAADGLSILRRLEKRGLVGRTERVGWWESSVEPASEGAGQPKEGGGQSEP